MLVQGGAKLVITDNSNNTVSVMRDDYDDDTTNDLNSPILCVLCGSSVINNPMATNPDADHAGSAPQRPRAGTSA